MQLPATEHCSSHFVKDIKDLALLVLIRNLPVLKYGQRFQNICKMCWSPERHGLAMSPKGGWAWSDLRVWHSTRRCGQGWGGAGRAEVSLPPGSHDRKRGLLLIPVVLVALMTVLLVSVYIRECRVWRGRAGQEPVLLFPNPVSPQFSREGGQEVWLQGKSFLEPGQSWNVGEMDWGTSGAASEWP